VPEHAALKRLHPLSLVFMIASAARSLILPGLLVLVFSSEDQTEVWFMLLFLPSVAVGIVRFLTLRYELGPDELVIREGLLLKKVRHVPYARVQNVDTEQGPQMIIPGAKACFSYDPRDGKELWHVYYKGFSNASRAVWGDGVAYINTGYGKPDLIAVKTDGKGEVTQSHHVWRSRRNIPKRSSPVLVDGLLYMNDDGGVAHCIDAKTGDTVWSSRLVGQHSASPICVDVAGEKRIYFFSERGNTMVVKHGRKFQPIGKGKLAHGFMASPAVAGNALYLRTTKHLYRIEQ